MEKRTTIKMVPPPVAPQKRTVWSNLCLLLWKNFVLQKRHKFQTLLDITLPVLMFVLLAFLQQFSSFFNVPKPIRYGELELNTKRYVVNFCLNSVKD